MEISSKELFLSLFVHRKVGTKKTSFCIFLEQYCLQGCGKYATFLAAYYPHLRLRAHLCIFYIMRSKKSAYAKNLHIYTYATVMREICGFNIPSKSSDIIRGNSTCDIFFENISIMLAFQTDVCLSLLSERNRSK